MFYLMIGKRVNAVAYGVSFGAFYMVGMATFGAFSGALTNNTLRIAQERRKAGSASSGSPRCLPTPT